MIIKWSILSKYRNELYGISILWIILFHGLQFKNFSLSNELKILDGIIKHGNCGVEIFLFLTGISLYYSLKRHDNLRRFYLNRLKRIFLPLLIIDGSYWTYIYIIKENNILKFIENITFYSFWVKGNQQVWFIALIILLYLIYPILFKFILENRKINKLNYIICLCISIYVFLLLFKYFDYQWYKLIEIAITRIPVFLLGCYCGILSYENRVISVSVKTISLIIFIIGIGYFYIKPISLVQNFRIPYLFIGPSITVWMAICLEIIENKNINTFLRDWGGVSLELYLSHIVLRRIFLNSNFYSDSAVANFHKYLIFVMFFSFVVSKCVNLVEKYIKGILQK